MFQIEHLPHAPELFFGLSAGYDRRDLKRAYGKAIRQYSPEDYPREFQLIREAYERLERELRDNRDQARSDEADQAWIPGNHPVEKNDTASGRPSSVDTGATSSDHSRRPDFSPSLQHLALADPAGTYRRLTEQATRSPQEYYVAAVLSDVIGDGRSAEYFNQILAGLSRHPSDAGLLALAKEYLRHEVDDADVVPVLERVVSNLRTPLFFPLTETLWTRLINTAPFEQWSELLKRCESEVRQVDPTQRSAFYVRLMKVAVWKAPIDWSHGQLEQLESHSVTLDEFSQFELEYLGHLHDLLRKHPDRDRLPPVKQKLLEAYKLHCQSDDPQSMRALIEHLARLSRDAAGFQKAFPVGTDHDDNSWVIATQLMINQVSGQSLPNASNDTDEMLSAVGKLLRDLAPTNQAVLEGQDKANSRFRTLPLVVWMVLGCVLGTPIIILPIALVVDPVGAILTMAMIVFLFVGLFISYFRWLYPKHLQKRQEHYAWRWLMHGYQRHWRQRLFRYSQSNNLRIGDMFRFLIEATEGTKWQPLGETLQYFGSQDAGLIIFVSIRSVTS
ncbi:J domain-containing protein [Roseiconus lacunae]|uniref:J domain-containing protein n=1 Tax=Roseiconus lacunae TaxID=2605694 RepID=UPI001E497460|nr:J domain-containing protein [Roseiconus lacunae]MCD0459619.1 J domain-containing protein [Roseiconus lacunae]